MIYFWLLVFTLIGPLLSSFDKRIQFYKKWKALTLAIVIPAFYFLLWDYFFTQWGVWGFNSDYLLGLEVLGLPIEEILFFFIVPYACLFIFESVNFHLDHRHPSQRLSVGFGAGLLLLLGALSFLFWGHHYTLFASLTSVVLLIVNLVIFKGIYLQKFYLSYLFCLIPFFLVNGVLTGTGLSSPIVWYNDEHNLGLRLGTIPMDDAIYLMAMLLFSFTVYQFTNALSRRPTLAPN